MVKSMEPSRAREQSGANKTPLPDGRGSDSDTHKKIITFFKFFFIQF